MAVRIKDIAIKCGVSEGTVDRALNDRGGIKKETKELILKTAKEMNYQSNHLASCLAKGRTMNIGVVCAGLTNTFFAQLIEEIERMASANGYFITLILAHDDIKRELEGIRYLANRQVDGLIIFPIGKGKEYEEEIAGYNIPIVTIYNRVSDKFIHVDVDCRQIMKDAVSKIKAKGYQRVVYMDPFYDREELMWQNRYSLNQRRQGYLDGIKEEGLGEPVIFTEYEMQTIRKILDAEAGKTAILCPFDNVAIRLLHMLKDDGIRVPLDVGIMGFDNVPMLEHITPKICSVDCGIQNLGRRAFQVLLQLIEGKTDICDCVTGYTFTEGESL